MPPARSRRSSRSSRWPFPPSRSPSSPINDDYLKSTPINRADTRVTARGGQDDRRHDRGDHPARPLRARGHRRRRRARRTPSATAAPSARPSGTTCIPTSTARSRSRPAASTSPSTSTSSTTAARRSCARAAARPSPGRRTSSSRACEGQAPLHDPGRRPRRRHGPRPGSAASWASASSSSPTATTTTSSTRSTTAPTSPASARPAAARPSCARRRSSPRRPPRSGITVKKLSVSATKGAKVEVRCRRALLGPPGAHGRGRVLPAAARARAAGRRGHRDLRDQGALDRHATRATTIVRGNFKRIDRCLRPGSHMPRRTCK